ncbi:Protein MEMO1 [Tritrichomonas foetus]|uniref:Protein MEMO1 n=1 Tax=Tritrichomonas foetus TaxID=1144522 RepID=A0A1J4KS62_9EUKA|nr:Protein MEMO1 [Tritrichomonas foetus]|eukprot:OHT12309.1 Protein MEMO1 [Tritrichomonas foetus]
MLGASHAGSWYPTGKSLENLLQSKLSEVKFKAEPGRLRAIIVPHAGYRFCVFTSLHAFAQIDPNQFDRVVVMGPSHRVRINCCTIADAKAAETPFGPIPFNMEMVTSLLTNHPSLFEKLDIDTAEIEHSLEMEFPLLKFIFKDKDFSIVPIMVGHVGYQKCAEIAAALEPFADERTLFVISSDFCHWGERFRYQFLPDSPGEVHEKIEKLDRDATIQISTGIPSKFEAYLDETHNTICGRFPILIMMNLIKGMRASFPHYSHSSNITSKNDSCVSYMAGVIRTD